MEGIRALEGSRPVTSPNLAVCWASVAEAHRGLGDFRRALEAAANARREAEASNEPDGLLVAHALYTSAAIKHQSGRHREAREEWEKALAIRVSQLGRTHELVGATLSGIASTLLAEGRAAEAEPVALEAVQILDKGPKSLLIAALNNHAASLRAQHKLAEAEPVYRRAVEISESSFGREHPDHAKILANFAAYLFEANRPHAAAQLYEQSASILLASLGPAHPVTAEVHRSLAEVYRSMRWTARAKRLESSWREPGFTLVPGSLPVPQSR
jgi:tetratricopeptide (TPR) repeat protein